MSDKPEIITPGPGTTRRAVAKGAAWAAPVIAVAGAAPTASASPVPDCPTCIKPFLGAYELAGLAASGKATLVFVSAFSLDATDCGFLTNIFQPAFTYVISQATLSMSDGATYNSTTGLAVGAGNLGTVGAMPGVFTFNNVKVSGPLFTGVIPPIHPTTLSVTINVTFKYGLGISLLCPMTLTWGLPGLGISAMTLGAGVVTYTGIST